MNIIQLKQDLSKLWNMFDDKLVYSNLSALLKKKIPDSTYLSFWYLEYTSVNNLLNGFP